MGTIWLIILSIILQCLAAIQALRLISITRHCWAWMLIVVALVLMVVHRGFIWSRIHAGDAATALDFVEAGLTLLIALLMLVGISLIGSIFETWQRSKQTARTSTDGKRASWNDNGQPRHLSGIATNGTEHKWAEQQLRARADRESMISEIARRFLVLEPCAVDAAIIDTLARLARFLGADNASLVQLAEDGQSYVRSHEWSDVAVGPPLDYPKQMPLRAFPWLHERLLEQGDFLARSLDDFPEEAAVEREVMARLRLSSVAMISLEIASQIQGVLHFSWRRGPAARGAEELRPLAVIGDIMLHAIRRQRAELALRRSQASLEAAQERAKLGSWEFDPHTGTATWSQEMYRLYQRPLALGPPTVAEFLDMHHSEDRPWIEHVHAQALAGDFPVSLDYRTNPDLGPMRYFNGIVSRSRDPVDGSYRLVGTVLDITERKQAEEALRVSEERFRFLTLATAAVIWTTNAQGEFAEPQWSWEAYTGQPWPAHAGWGWTEMLHPDDRERLLETWRQALTDKSMCCAEGRIWQATTRSYRYFIVRGVPLCFEDGTVREWVGAVTDIDDRKRAEEELHRLNRELEQRVRERTARLETANRDLESFAYSVSHDLRAPLRAISGFAQIIARRHRQALDEEGQHYFDNIVEASRRMEQLIDDLLTYSRVGRRQVRRQRVPLDDILKPILRDLEGNLRQAGGAVTLPEELPRIHGDPTLLKQIFVNLLDNAILYRRRDVPLEISITCEHTDQGMIVRIQDNGIGIAEEHHAKIFNVFQRLHGDDVYPGTGIGLATVKKAAELHGGRVWVESKVNQGSRFCVFFPDPV